jgi:predicted site-specific integrase-resolvase
VNDLLDIDEPEPMTLVQAAELVGRSKDAVKKWVSRGLLPVILKDKRGILVDRRDVERLDRDTRHRRGRVAN